MKSIKILSGVLAAAAMFSILPAAAQGQSGKLRCIDVKNIRDTVSRDDGRTLSFRLRDGTNIINTLRTPCDGLKFTGFTWATGPNGEICENVQTLRVFDTGEICRLGKFQAPMRSATAFPR